MQLRLPKHLLHCHCWIFLAFLPFVSCTTDPTLNDVPKPGLVGEAKIDIAHDRASEHILSFDSRASEQELRSSFERYCTHLGLTKRTPPSPLKEETWYDSPTQGLGISISPGGADKSLLHVSIFHRS